MLELNIEIYSNRHIGDFSINKKKKEKRSGPSSLVNGQTGGQTVKSVCVCWGEGGQVSWWATLQRGHNSSVSNGCREWKLIPLAMNV